MEKNIIIAFALSIAVLLAFQLMFPPPAPVKKQAQAPSAPAGNVTTAAQPAVPAQAAAPAAAAPAIPAVPSEPEREIMVETDLVSAVISSHGGVIKSWKVKNYKDAAGAPVEMARPGALVRPLAVAPSGTYPQAAQTLSWRADKESLTLAAGEKGEITLTCALPGGGSVVKTLGFAGGSYAVSVKVESTGIPGYMVYLGDGFGSVTNVADKERTGGHVGPIVLADGDKDDIDPEEITQGRNFAGKAGWAGITDKYFLGALVSAGALRAYVYKGMTGEGMVGLAAAGTSEYVLYAGPKEYDRLKALGHDLQRAVEFGWFTWFAKPLFVLLKYLYGLVKNWGWAIIALTFIIKLAFAPLTHKSQKSMKRMQKLQPMFAELKEKYKSDPTRLNREMMDLYKREKVNPMSGCLPMLIQLPVFVALYNVLNHAVELRGAPFALWLTDLSVKDPYYILPVAMGASMILMQKLTPTAMDPKQNMMMMGMSVFMTFLFISMPSGLVLYFTVSNLLSIVQQVYINKYAEE